MSHPNRSLFVDARAVRRLATGVGSYTAGLLGGLDRLAGHREGLRVVALKLADSGHPAWEALRHVEVVETPVDYESHPRGDWFLHAGLPRLAARCGCDTLVSPAFLAPLGPCRSRRVVIVHDLLAWDHPGDLPAGFRRYLKLMTRGALGRAEVVATSSAVLRRPLRERFHRLAHLLPPAADGFAPSPRVKEGLPDGSPRDLPVLLYTASPNPRKNHGLLFRALGILHARGRSCRLVLLDGDGAGLRRAMGTEERAAPGMRAALAHTRIIAPRSMQEVAAWTRAAEACVFPSLAEGFGIPMLEAMRSGTPLFASDIPAARWLTGEGRAARLLPPNDAEAWAEALEAFLSGRDAGAEQRRAEGLRRAGVFSWERTARRLVEISGD